MATKKKEDSKKKGSEKVKDEAKEAKRKARMEALKNRPAEQIRSSQLRLCCKEQRRLSGSSGNIGSGNRRKTSYNLSDIRSR